jgi:hypothetical protein
LNYNIGENYYKSALDRLDEKSGRAPSSLIRSSEPPVLKPSVRLAQLDEDGTVDDLEIARTRASHAIQRETILDQRTGRKAVELEADFDSQVQRTLNRINASKKLLSNIEVENGYDNELASSSIIKKRVVKVTTDISSSSNNASQLNDSVSRWTKVGGANDSESFAVARARNTANRLVDLENDMAERSERQYAREQRAANVKKLLAETSDFSDDAAYGNVASYKVVKSSQKRVTTY